MKGGADFIRLQCSCFLLTREPGRTIAAPDRCGEVRHPLTVPFSDAAGMPDLRQRACGSSWSTIHYDGSNSSTCTACGATLRTSGAVCKHTIDAAGAPAGQLPGHRHRDRQQSLPPAVPAEMWACSAASAVMKETTRTSRQLKPARPGWRGASPLVRCWACWNPAEARGRISAERTTWLAEWRCLVRRLR